MSAADPLRPRRRWLRYTGGSLCLVLVVGVGYSWQRGWLERSYWRATVGCGDQDWTPAPPVPDDRDLVLGLEPLDGDFAAATSVAFHPDDPSLAYVTEQAGTVRVVRDGVAEDEPALDVDASVEHDQGLLAGAVDAGGDWLHLLYTDAAGDSVLEAVPLDADGAPEPDGAVVELLVPQPTVHHNGGGLLVLPDGTLLVTLGDGGRIGDRDDHGQRADTLLGGILRIRPTPGADPPYEIPDDNPFADGAGGAPETWALGLRNPFRLGYDPVEDEVWVNDVGHDCYEEISVVTATRPASAPVPNFGWNRYEGTRVFLGGEPDGYVAPRVAMPHADGQACAVIGGAVARGGAAPSLTGEYVFADLCRARLLAIDADDPAPVVRELPSTPPGTFGVTVDAAGDVWIVSPTQVARLVEG